MKRYLRIDEDDTSLDTVIASLLQSGQIYCEQFQNRTLGSTTWELVLDQFPTLPMELPNPPLQSVVSITYIDESGIEHTWESSNYLVDTTSDPGRIAALVPWPDVTLQPINGVRIQFVTGYDEVPENVKNAIKIFVAHRFENPEQQNVPNAVASLLWPDRIVPV